MTRTAPTLAALLVGATLAAPAAFAQPAPLTMPPPPSASDPAPRAERAAKPARKPAKTRASSKGTVAQGDRPTSSRSDMSDRIDTRGPAGRRMEMEDDPRVQPTMQNGRPGLGMRF